MKKRKEQPSLAGLLLIVTGMLLISIVLLSLTGTRNLTADSAKIMIALGCVAVASLAAGATLSARKKR